MMDPAWEKLAADTLDLVLRSVAPDAAGWEEQKSDKGITIYRRRNPDPTVKFDQWKAVAKLPFDIKKASFYLNDCAKRKEWDSTVSEFDILKKVNDTIDVMYCATNPILGGAISSRDYVDLRIQSSKEDGTSTVAGVSIVLNDCPQKSGRVRGWNYPGGIQLVPDKEGCHIQYLVCSDIKGWLPAFTVSAGLSGALISILSTLISVASSDK